MFHVRRSWVAAIAAGLALSCAGCTSKPSQKPPGTKVNAGADEDSEEASAPESRPAAHESKPEEPPPPPTIPKVNLSDELRASCLVRVGDTLPKAELADNGGKMHSLDSFYGKKLTVVCVWTGASRRHLEAADALNSLSNDIAKPFGKKGVQVIGIEDGRNFVDMDAWRNIHETIAALPFPCLTDGKGRFLASIAKDDKLPRVFLLDAEGKILWFDVEYSRSTREDLVQGIRVALGELK